MKALHRHAPRAAAFTLLEVIIVLAITALLLGAVYSLAQGTLLLADDVRRAERRDARTQAFTTFCEHLFGELPASAMLNLSATQNGGQYLTRLELEHVRSPFDETPECRVTLFTQGQPGGGLRLMLTCHSEANESSVVLFEDLAQCEWSVFHPTTRQWASFWSEDNPGGVPTAHPPLMKFVMSQAGGEIHEQIFWITPSEPNLLTAAPIPAPLPPKSPQ
ncbi:MAG: type II secretion system GspH family protein [Prosthecobacter sp.]|uniref:type II secretion system protein n=1 Tax=Prosthecobacter sp. TaxID=1965333 RepID=UPI002630E0E8|nr:prepilin-type N-terminal cleavage/methylation domain-containing protein [Prosthecobacter sp.]MCF7790201.1 type II secretion system GspH family protein [Prosthecobacter sp.]